VATEQPHAISTQYILRGTLVEIEPAGEGLEVFVRLATGPSEILARITRDSVRRLALRPGMEIWALVKAVTFDHRLVAAPPPAEAAESERRDAVPAS